MRTDVSANDFLIFSNGDLILTPLTLSGIRTFSFLEENSAELQQFTANAFIGEEGILFTSRGLAFFTTDLIFGQTVIGITATAMPVQIVVDVVRISSDPFVLLLDVENRNFTMRLTGSPTKILSIVTDNRILYAENTLTVRQGILTTTEFPDINMLAVLQLEPGTTNIRYRVLFTEAPDVILGPGQVHIGVNENRAFFVEDLPFRGGDRDIIGFINEQVFLQAFNLRQNISGVDVEDHLRNRTVTLTRNTSKFDAPNAAEATYIGPQRLLVLRDRGGRVNSFPGIGQFSIFENNSLQIFKSSSSDTSMHLLCTGGTVFVDGSAALFVGISSPFVISELCDNIPVPDGISYIYDIVGDSDSKLVLRSIEVNMTNTLRTEEQTPIQVVTGLYVTTVKEPEAVSFRNNTVLVRDFFDNTVTRIEGVKTLYVNTEDNQFRSYENQSPVPFHGPGTLTFSRGTAFFTTDRTLGSDLAFQARTAGVPTIDIRLIATTVNDIDGENFTESTVAVKIGGDRVITFEASSYRTSTDQEILYAGDRLTVHRPILVGEGNVTYIGSTQTVTYADNGGTNRTITGVTRFQDYSGGEVRTTTSTDDTFVQGPGKIYVSEDSSSVLFSSSNLISAEVAAIIRNGATDFSIEVDQLSSVYARIFNISNNSATVTYPGGGVIYYSTFDGRRESLYLESSSVTNRLRRDISAYIPLTKSVAQEDLGIINIIYNGRSVYRYRPIQGSRDIVVSGTESFTLNGTTISGLSYGTITGVNRLVLHDGIELEIFNESSTPVVLSGYGLLLVQMESDTAFYTTLPFSVNLFLQTIIDVREYLIPPVIKLPRNNGKITTKKLTDTFRFGTNVKAFAGASITFTCAATGRPAPTFEFFRVVEGDTRIALNESQTGVSIEEDSVTLSSIGDADSGTYGCTADNTVPPADVALSTLNVKEADAPSINPGWFPFILRQNQSIFWPVDPAPSTSTSLDVQLARELVFACRVGGKPRPNVMWEFNNLQIQEAIAIGLLDNTSVSITTFPNARSVLIIAVEANQDILRGRNEIACSAANAGGATTGRITLEGTYYNCIRTGAGECSRTCGRGFRTVLYMCTVTRGDLTEETIPASLVPDELVPFGRTEVCDVTDMFGDFVICPVTDYRWNTSEWTECSRTCGGGSRSRNVSCLNISIPITIDYRAKLDQVIESEANITMCAMSESAGVRPTSRELCNTDTCPIWVAEEEFSECSVTCGVGVQSRDVTCNIITGNYIDEFGDMQFNLTVVNSSLCGPEKQPPPTKECKPTRCLYEWRPLPFGRVRSTYEP
jgi:hypothetical protein